jgi:hypothetical protein
VGCSGNTRLRRRQSFLILFTFVLLAHPALAAPVAAQSALTGIVHDPSGRVAAGAIVRVTDVATRTQKYETFVSSIGYFEIELPAGDYKVEAALGPLSYSGTIRVYPQEKTAFDVTLQARVGSESETVVGTTSGDAIEGSAAIGGTFSREAINALTLSNGRTLQSLQSLVPGIVFTDSTGTLATFTAAGQRRFANSLTVDGIAADLGVDLSTRGSFGIGEGGSGALPSVSTLGGTQILVPLDAIEEIRIRTTDAPPDIARTPGAQTIIVTRAGGGRFSGTGFLDRRLPSLGANDWFSNASGGPQPRRAATRVGASAGGPVFPQRLTYFATWESQIVDRSQFAIIPTPSLTLRGSAAREFLDAFPEPNGADLENGLAERVQIVPAKSMQSTLSIRTDATVTQLQRFFIRYNQGHSSGDWLGDTGAPALSFTNREATSLRTLTVGVNAFASSSGHELRANISMNRGTLTASAASYGDARPLPLDVLSPAGADADAWSRVTLFPGPGGFLIAGRTGDSTQRQLQIADSWTVLLGRHEWRVGGDYRRVEGAADGAPDKYTYRFAGPTDLLAGRVRQLTLDHATPARALTQSWSVFAQDTLRLMPRVELSYGVRYAVAPAPRSLTGTQPLLFDIDALPQLQPLPSGASMWETSWHDLSPRVMGTYQMVAAAGHETSLHAGWSLTHDAIIPPGAAPIGGAYPFTWTKALPVSVFPVPAQTLATAPPSFEAATIAQAYALPKKFRTPKTHEWHVGLDHAIGRTQRLSVTYAGAAGRDLPYRYAYSLNPTHRVNAFSNVGTSDYHALLGEYVRRSSRGLQMRLAYTWSHAIDLDSGESSLPNPPPANIAPRSNRASADFDRRHVLRASMSWPVRAPWAWLWVRRMLEDWRIELTGAIISGAPVTVIAARDLGFGRFDFRPDLINVADVWMSAEGSPTGRALNASAFLAPTDRQGTLGRNTIIASPLRQVDFGLARTVHANDRIRAQLRIEVSNVLNVANFGPPRGDMLLTDFGKPRQTYAQALGTGTLTGGGLVPLEQTGGPRAIQVGVRVDW